MKRQRIIYVSDQRNWWYTKPTHLVRHNLESRKGGITDCSVVEMQNQLPFSVETVLSIDDLLMEILLRLPAESILRFKLVSKYWYSVITNPEFSLRHTRKQAATGILFLTCDFLFTGTYDFVPLCIECPASPPFTKLPLIDDPSFCVRIQQSCNGLLLCSSFQRLSLFDLKTYLDFRYFVCNATTKRFVTLPNPRLEAQKVRSSPWIQGMSLAFDPAKSPHYEVVCVTCFTAAKKPSYAQFQIEVYFSETRSWRKSGKIFKAKYDFGKHGVFWNGAVHWMYNGCKDLCYYKVDVETLHMMPMPPLQTHRRLVESCDHLHLIEAKKKSLGVHLSIYEMERDRSEWFFKYRIDLLSPIEKYRKLTLLVLVRNKEDDDAYLVVGTTAMGTIFRYHLVNNAASAVPCESPLPQYRNGKKSRYLLAKKKAASEESCESYAYRKGEGYRYLASNSVSHHPSQFFEFIESFCSV